MKPETVIIDAQLFQYVMIVMYGIFSLMVLVVGAYIALFKRAIENKIDGINENKSREIEHINSELTYIRGRVDNIYNRPDS